MIDEKKLLEWIEKRQELIRTDMEKQSVNVQTKRKLMIGELEGIKFLIKTGFFR